MATCDHCHREIHHADAGMMDMAVRSPIMVEMAYHRLCGFCSFPLGEWLCPALKEDVVWNTERMEVIEKLKGLYGIEGAQTETM